VTCPAATRRLADHVPGHFHRLARGAVAQLAGLGEPLDKPRRVSGKERQVVGFERPFRRGAQQVPELDRRIAGVDGGLLHRPAEECFRVLNVVLVEGVIAGDQYDHCLAVGATSYATSLLPEAHVAAWIPSDHRYVQRADVNPQFERVRRDHPAQLAAPQPGLDLSAFFGVIPGLVGADPAREIRADQAPHVQQHPLDRYSGTPEQDAAVAGPQRFGEHRGRFSKDALVLVGADIAP